MDVETEDSAAGRLDQEVTSTAASASMATAIVASLPEELLVRIFRLLSLAELPVMALVCRRWHRVLKTSGVLWRNIYVDPTRYGYRQFSMLTTVLRSYGQHVHSLEWLDSAPVYESVFALIPRLQHLRSLRLPILWTRAVVESLAPLSHLEEIHVNGGFAFTDTEMELVAISFPKLRLISLNACWSVTHSAVVKLLSSLSFLQEVKLKVNSSLPLNDMRSEAAMMEGANIVQSMSSSPSIAPCVTVLCLHFVPIEMEELWDIVNNLVNLRKLSISNCEHLHGIRLQSPSLQKLYLFNLWSVLFVSITGDNLRHVTIDYGLESMENLEIFAPRLRRVAVDGSNVLRTINVKSNRLLIADIYNCEQLDTRTLKSTLEYNYTIASLRLGKIPDEDLYLDEICCPSIQELCLLNDFSSSTLHIRSPTLRLIHSDSDTDLHSLIQLYVVANHLCKVALVGVPALRSLTIQCVSVDAIELNLCSDEFLSLESCVIQALSSIGFLRLFDCQLNLLAVMTPVARTVVLYRCQMSDYVLQMALTGCSNIDHLNLEKCLSLTKINVQAPPMRYLNLFGCREILRVDLDCPNLVALNMGQCPKVRLFLNDTERSLTEEGQDPKIVLPNETIRWTHQTPPQILSCR